MIALGPFPLKIPGSNVSLPLCVPLLSSMVYLVCTGNGALSVSSCLFVAPVWVLCLWILCTSRVQLNLPSHSQELSAVPPVCPVFGVQPITDESASYCINDAV